MLTQEQKQKLRDAGYSEVKINAFEAQKAIKENANKPKEPTFAGNVIRETVRPLAKLATNVVNTGQAITGKEITKPFSGEYLGEVNRIGENFDITKGFTPENISAIKDAVKSGVDIGVLLGGGAGTGSVAKAGIKQGIKQGVIQGAKTGSIVGGISGAGTGLEEDATLGSTLKNTAMGVAGGAVAGGVLGGVAGAIPSKQTILNITSKAKGQTGKIVDNKTPKLLSIFTGEDTDVVKTAMKFPEIADQGIVGGDEALRKAVQTGATSSLKARTDFSKAYNQAFKNLVKGEQGKLVSRQNVLYKFVDDLKAVGVNAKKGDLDFSTSLISANPGEAAKIRAAYESIINWKDFSLNGTNELKQIVGRLTKFPTETGGTSKSPFLGKFYNFLDKEIKTNLPKDKSKLYANMNKKFSDNIELYDDMVDAFNSGDPFTKLSGIFGKNKDTLRQIVDFYEKTTGNKISPIVAGRTLAEEKPAAFGFLNPRQWIDFLISPQTQAKIVTKTGKILQSAKNQPSIIKKATGIKINPNQTNKSNPISPNSTTKTLKGKGTIPENSLISEAKKYKSIDIWKKANKK